MEYMLHKKPNDLRVTISMLERSDQTMATCLRLITSTSMFLCILKPNNHVLVVDSVYDPLKQHHVRCSQQEPTSMLLLLWFFDPRDDYNLKTSLRTNTKLIYLESPYSSTFEILNIHSIRGYIKQRPNKCVISMDNFMDNILNI